MPSPLLVSNNAQSTLAGSISNVATTANLAAGTGVLFPAPVNGQYFVATLVSASNPALSEIVHVTNVTADTVTLVRAQEGTTAQAWNANDQFLNFMTAGSLLVFPQMIANAGNPNGLVAGAAASGLTPPTFVADPTDLQLWMCTTSGAAGSAVWAALSRAKLLTNLTLTVNASTGNDTTGNGTVGAPWATLQKAWNYIQGALDLNGFTVTVNCTGAFAAGVLATGICVGQSGPASVVFNFTAGATVALASGTCFTVEWGAQLQLQSSSTGVTLSSTTGSGILAFEGGIVYLAGAVNFGAMGGEDIVSGTGGQIRITGSYSKSGSAVNHLWAELGGRIIVRSAITITMVGTPAFTTTCFCTDSAVIDVDSTQVTRVGSATGTRYIVNGNAVIDTVGGGASFFFGSIAGSAASGGQYL